MFISLIIATVSLILDIILNNFLPYMLGNLSFFTPMFTVVSLLFIYYFFRKRERHYYIFSFILGVVYDLIFTNLLFYNGILFLAISFIVTILYKYLDINYFNVILDVLIIIVIYELFNFIIIFIFNLAFVSFYRLFYKIIHSLVLNIIYAEVVYLIINLLPKKYTKLNIN